MKEIPYQVQKTVHADTYEEFDELVNKTAKELAEHAPVTEELDDHTTRFKWQERSETPETLGDEFETHGICITCADCPFLEIGTDARRKWFPCEYTTYGMSKLDSPACDVYFHEAVKMMRERAKK